MRSAGRPPKLTPSALAAAEAAAVAALAAAAAKTRVQDRTATDVAEAAALANLTKAAVRSRDAPRPPKAAPPKKAPAQPRRPPPRHVLARLIGATRVASPGEMAKVVPRIWRGGMRRPPALSSTAARKQWPRPPLKRPTFRSSATLPKTKPKTPLLKVKQEITPALAGKKRKYF
mmetsp:Transcript_141229/g.367615  ORF Transcript_141229/g.367615 Transcript_141229/m.367615 type:complete len:174 (-) Transcript_141229:90-611(-)